MGPGITAKTISVGLLDPKNLAAEQAALGNTVNGGDVHAYAQLVMRDINRHGGIAGRRIAPVWHSFDANTTQTAEQIGEAACADFTQDHHVFAALGLTHQPQLTGTLNCLKKAGTVAGLTSSVAENNEAAYDAFPADYDVSAITLNRLCANLIPSLVAGGYFGRWNTTTGQPGTTSVKVGVLAPDTPPYRDAITHVCLPALARAGYPVSPSDMYFFAWGDSTSDNGRILADIESAELKFAEQGVTHVIPIEQNGTAFFGRTANSQHHFPRYGVNTHSGA